MIREVLAFVRERLDSARTAPPSQYKAGMLDALSQMEEYILDLMWDAGEEDETDDLQSE